MADGNRSAKGKAVVVVVDDEIGSTSCHMQGSQSHGDLSSHGGSRAAVDDRRDGGDYSAGDDLPTNFDYNNGISTSSLARSTAHMDSSRVYTTQHQYVDPGYRYWPTGGHGGGSTASFHLPFSGGAGGIPAGPQHVRTGNQLFTGIGSNTQQDELYHSANANGGGVGATFLPSPHIGGDGNGMHYAPHHAPTNSGRRPRSPLVPWSMEQIDSFIGNSLRSLSIRDRGGSLLARDRGGRRLSSEFVNNLQAPQDNLVGGRRLSSEFVNNLQVPQDNLVGGGTGGQNNNPAAASLGRGRLSADQYVGRRLEDVRGSMSSVARNTPGCRFLVRVVAEGGAATAQQVLDEVAFDVVRLMVHADGHALVEALVQYLADESMARVLEILDAASPAQIVAVARSHHGSNILQALIGRIAGNPGHAESFTRTLARVGERGVLSLTEDMDGSRLIMRCLDTFSAAHNQFITVAMAMSLRRVCRDRHGCHVVNRCIDMASVDGQMWGSLVHAVCWDGFALAEHGYGNYVVQHVLRCVPPARASLHAAFRGRYVSLSTQMAGSHVVQRCLELFSPEQADEIVGELLGCHHWGACTFQQLISDRFANFVLQTAMERTEIQMHNRLLDAIIVHNDELRENMFARNIYRKLCTLRRIYRSFRAT